MLETVMEHQVIIYAMGIVAGMGILSKLISHITLRRMVRAASEMNKSNHKLMKLVKAKFEHASMVSDKVRNVGAFVKKYIYEYRTFGIRLHTWRQLEKKAVWMYGILGAAGAAGAYQIYGAEKMVLQYAIWGAIGAAILYFVHISTDEQSRLEAVENYMIDFLENVCVHRYAKTYQQNEVEEETEEELQEEAPVMNSETLEEPEEPEEEKIPQEMRIRKILEEFLA